MKRKRWKSLNNEKKLKTKKKPIRNETKQNKTGKKGMRTKNRNEQEKKNEKIKMSSGMNNKSRFRHI